jgi:hypothetical protein
MSYNSIGYMDNIRWKSVEGYVGYYEVSNRGDVRSLLNQARNRTKIKVLASKRVSGGYLGNTLCRDGLKKQVLVHRLVARAFLPNPDNLPQVNHKDGDKKNNRVENLEWTSSQNNIHHSFLSGTWHQTNRRVLDLDRVREIRGLLDSKAMTGIAVARKYGISPHTVCNIRKRHSWKFVN